MTNVHKFWYHFHHNKILSSQFINFANAMNFAQYMYYEAAMPKLHVCYPPKLLLVIQVRMNFANGISLIVFLLQFEQ